jgi:hypothetical protein
MGTFQPNAKGLRIGPAFASPLAFRYLESRVYRYVAIEHPWISSVDKPLYRWTFPAEATDEELQSCFRAREEWAPRAQHPVAWVVDLTHITKAPATQRKAFAEHLKRFEDYNIRWNAGSALVVPNAWVRGVVTAAFWITPPKFPNKLFTEPNEAEAWARAQLRTRLVSSA